MSNRNYNFKLRLNQQQRIKLLTLSKSNGFDNVSDYIRNKVLKEEKHDDLIERKITSNFSNLDYESLLKFFQKVKLNMTTYEYINNNNSFLYVVSNSNEVKMCAQLFNIIGKQNFEVISLEDYLSSYDFSVNNRVVVFQNAILQSIVNFGINNYNKNLQLNKTICQLIQKVDKKQVSICDTQLDALIFLSSSFEKINVEYDTNQLTFKWLNDQIIFKIKNNSLWYSINISDTKEIFNMIFSSGFVCFEQLSSHLNNIYTVGNEQIDQCLQYIKQLYLIFDYMLKMKDVSDFTKDKIKKLFRIDNRRNSRFQFEYTRYLSVECLLQAYYNRIQPYFSVLNNDQQYSKQIDFFEKHGLYDYKKILQIAHFKCKKQYIFNYQFDKDVLSIILKHKPQIKNEDNSEEVNNLFDNEDYNSQYVKQTYESCANEFSQKLKVEHSL